MTRFSQWMPVLALVGIGGCASLPTAPSVMALPGTGKNFDQFRLDDSQCRGYAYAQIGGVSAGQARTASGVTSAAVGTALGAAAGAALGGGQGAAAGAGVGLIGGSLVGVDQANSSGYGQQERYDQAYVQCMYAQGHRVPVWGEFAESTTNPPPSTPPPPAGSPPPPPPDAPLPGKR